VQESQHPSQTPYGYPDSSYGGSGGGYGGPGGGFRGQGGFGGPSGNFSGAGPGLGMGYRNRRGKPRGPNSFSWTAIGFAVAYVILAATTGFVLLGIVPIISSVRAFQRKEKLAPLAAAAAVIAVGSAIYILSHGHR
jgi:hypothetical protein